MIHTAAAVVLLYRHLLNYIYYIINVNIHFIKPQGPELFVAVETANKFAG